MDSSKQRRIKPKSQRLSDIKKSMQYQKSLEAYQRLNYDILIAKKKLREEDLKRFQDESTL